MNGRFYGVGEPLIQRQRDQGIDAAAYLDLVAGLGCRAYRSWMHLTELLEGNHQHLGVLALHMYRRPVGLDLNIQNRRSLHKLPPSHVSFRFAAVFLLQNSCCRIPAAVSSSRQPVRLLLFDIIINDVPAIGLSLF